MKLVQDEAPRYFEACRLKAAAVIAGWPLAGAAAVTGVLLAATAGGSTLQAAGVLLAACAAVLVAGLIRCRTIEVVATSRLLSVAAGPLRRRVPVGLIEAVGDRRARSWRRLYSDTELELTLSGERGSITVPTREPDVLAEVLRQT